MVTTETLARPFLDAAPPGVRSILESLVDLDRRLWGLVAEGRAAWPDLQVPAKDLVEFVARQLTPDLADAALDGLRPAGFFPSCGLSKGGEAGGQAVH